MMDRFDERRILGLFRIISNRTCYAGHARLFGLKVHHWHNEIGGYRGSNDWAEHRIWTVGLVALHHVTRGKKSTNREGWSLTFARLRAKQLSNGIQITWSWADTFRTRPQ